MAFNVQEFVLNFSNKLLAQSGGGGFRNIDALKRELRKNVALTRRRKVESARGAFGATGVQSTAQLFTEGAAEQQAAAEERTALTALSEQDAQLRNQATAQAQRTAVGAAPIAQEEANRPSFIEKIGGALVGGVASAFIPQLAMKLFPSAKTQPKPPAIPSPAPDVPVRGEDMAFASSGFVSPQDGFQGQGADLFNSLSAEERQQLMSFFGSGGLG